MAASGQRGDATGRNRRSDADARKARALPLVVAGKPYAEVGKAVNVSARTVRRWVEEDPDFKDAIEASREAAADAVDNAAEKIAGIVTASLAALAELVQSEDEKIRLEATKTALDRFGHPVKREERTEHTGQAAAVVLTVTAEQARKAARMEG